MRTFGVVFHRGWLIITTIEIEVSKEARIESTPKAGIKTPTTGSTAS